MLGLKLKPGVNMGVMYKIAVALVITNETHDLSKDVNSTATRSNRIFQLAHKWIVRNRHSRCLY